MGNYTTNLSLYNTDMTTDGNDYFNFDRDISGNNNIIDAAIGKLSTLTTTEKTSLVGAINELDTSKADIDLSNVNSTGLSYGAGWAMPSGTSTNFTVGASGSTYTAPATGWFVTFSTALAVSSWVSMASTYGNTDTVSINTVASSANEGLYCYVPIYKNQKMRFTYSNVSNITVKFVYAMGEV